MNQQDSKYVLVPIWIFPLSFFIYVFAKDLSNRSSTISLVAIMYLGKILGSRESNPKKSFSDMEPTQIADVMIFTMTILALAPLAVKHAPDALTIFLEVIRF